MDTQMDLLTEVKRNRKLTITASSKSIEKAEKALIRLGFESKSNFAKSQLIGRTTVTKFFQSKPIQLDSFKRICQALKLDWREIAGIADENRLKPLTRNDSSSSELVEGVEQGQAPRREVTVIDKQSKTIKASIVLEGDIDSVKNLEFIQSILRAYSGDSINIIDIQPGSIRLIIEGSPEDIEQLISRIESGELKELSSFPVQDIEILRETSEDDQNNELDPKWRLVEEIASRGAVRRDLSNADLSDADLSNADLSDANLIGANLSNADLSDADLSYTILSGADLSDAYLNSAHLRGAYLNSAHLSGADFSDSNLIAADFRGADLSDTNLIGADVKNARFGNNSGIDESMKRDLIKRGAIFEDLPGDRSESLTPSKR
ncbi:pentapeptide repeat-containing protein [Moorena producens JHB]|uniref:Pentapeptide repeat-containing protein n=1 Tax=Moorena producens (strain JHB) TaxID=1454205 RepID=A0A1D9GA32_MOOP1|nr:pentapeptide repeat-containing protein [Moorena producens]AOY84499.2 pentapeptide repeat-containing protein [Moorena producens JHB]